VKRRLVTEWALLKPKMGYKIDGVKRYGVLDYRKRRAVINKYAENQRQSYKTHEKLSTQNMVHAESFAGGRERLRQRQRQRESRRAVGMDESEVTEEWQNSPAPLLPEGTLFHVVGCEFVIVQLSQTSASEHAYKLKHVQSGRIINEWVPQWVIYNKDVEDGVAVPELPVADGVAASSTDAGPLPLPNDVINPLKVVNPMQSTARGIHSRNRKERQRKKWSHLPLLSELDDDGGGGTDFNPFGSPLEEHRKEKAGHGTKPRRAKNAPASTDELAQTDELELGSRSRSEYINLRVRQAVELGSVEKAVGQQVVNSKGGICSYSKRDLMYDLQRGFLIIKGGGGGKEDDEGGEGEGGGAAKIVKNKQELEEEWKFSEEETSEEEGAHSTYPLRI
jgi:hypothetical protein